MGALCKLGLIDIDEVAGKCVDLRVRHSWAFSVPIAFSTTTFQSATYSWVCQRYQDMNRQEWGYRVGHSVFQSLFWKMFIEAD